MRCKNGLLQIGRGEEGNGEDFGNGFHFGREKKREEGGQRIGA